MAGPNGWKLNPDKFKLEIRYKFLTVRVIKLWNSLSGYVMDSPWFGLFKSRMHVFHRNTPLLKQKLRGSVKVFLKKVELHDLDDAEGQATTSEEIRICESKPKQAPCFQTLHLNLMWA